MTRFKRGVRDNMAAVSCQVAKGQIGIGKKKEVKMS
jgi:hypothetical protein